jgi:CDP-diacylglycerol--glycerol-3-phosphate 3-phosphatidyltransferase
MWRHIPNAISLTRLAVVPILVRAVATGEARFFRWLLLACLLSDILDGLIARTFNLRSQLGAFLDSIADILVQFTAIGGLWVFHRQVVESHQLILLTAVAMYLGQMIVSLLRYGRISSFHTILIRIAAYAQGIFFVSLFFWGYTPTVFYAAAIMLISALAEEFVLLYLLPEWTADVGGLYWVLYRNQSSPAQ